MKRLVFAVLALGALSGCVTDDQIDLMVEQCRMLCGPNPVEHMNWMGSLSCDCHIPYTCVPPGPASSVAPVK